MKILEKSRVWTVVIGILFVAGLFIVGSLLPRGREGEAQSAADSSWLAKLFGKKIPVPGEQSDFSFVFSNFESLEDLKAWELTSASVEISTEQAMEGKSSAKVTFFAGQWAGITLEDFFSSRGGKSDWSAYEALQFSIFNTHVAKERLILQIKDKSGARYKQDLLIPPGETQLIRIPLAQISQAVKIKNIDQLTLFSWGLPETRQFYIDEIKLVPWGAKQAKNSKAYKGPKAHPVNRYDYDFEAKKPAWVIKDLEEFGKFVRAPFIVMNESPSRCVECPVEGGIPFPMSELKDTEHLRLRQANKEELPFQANVLSRWADGSIKWLNLHFDATLGPGEGRGYFLDYGPNIQALTTSSFLRVSENDEEILVETGKIQAHLSKKSFYLFEKVISDLNENAVYESSETVTSKARLTLKFNGQNYYADLDHQSYHIEIEEKGAERIVVKAAGWLQSQKGHRFCQVLTRLYFYEGKSFVKLAHTLIYTGYPQNSVYEPYKKLKLPKNEPVEAYGIELPLPLTDTNTELNLGAESGQVLNFNQAPAVRIKQLEWEQTRIENGKTHAALPSPLAGWMELSNPNFIFTTAIRRFRENFPKAFVFDAANASLNIDLWPEEAGPMDLSTGADALGPDDYARGNAFGLAKTHELFLDFPVAPGNAQSSALSTERARSFRNRLLIRSNPFWVDATGAFGRLYPADVRYATEEQMLERLFDWAARHPKNFKWYGLLDFGDTLTWYRNEDESKWYEQAGWNPVGRWGWYNCEGVGTHTGALLQFIRTGAWKYFEFGENLSRHLMDIDTIHYNTIAEDPRLKKLDQKMSQPGAMHRHSANHWSGRTDESSHTSVVGLLHYYHLTGDERARDVIHEIGEFFLREPFTYIGHPDIAPHRAMANALWGDVLLYEFTGNEKFKKAADKIIEIYLQGQEPDGSFLENYNPQEGTWSGEKHLPYMEGYALGAFMAYHELTQDEEVKAMLLKFIHFLEPQEFSGPAILHGLSYAYLITHDTNYLARAERKLQFILSHQQSSSDPLQDGLIYNKPIYHRPMTFLSTVPYIFGALEEGFAEYGNE